MIKTFVSISSSVLVGFLWAGCSCNSSGPSTNFPIDVGQRPESITTGFGGNFFVTVMNGQEPGDGVVKIIQGDTATVFASGLDEPKGIAFSADHLVVSDITKVVKIDSNGNTSVLAAADAFPYRPNYLNDVSPDAEGKGVYVTDMGANTKMRNAEGELWPLDSPEAAAMPVEGRVYHVDMDGKVTLVIDANRMMTNPNGVSVGKDGQLLVGAFFQGNLLEQRDGELKILAHGLRGADAVEQDSKGNYYVSSWSQAKVWKISEDGTGIEILKEGLQSAADFYLDEENNRLLLPDMLAGKVYEVKLSN